MNSKRIEEIQKETAYPESQSVQQALLKVWNETEQAHKNNEMNLPIKLTIAEGYMCDKCLKINPVIIVGGNITLCCASKNGFYRTPFNFKSSGKIIRKE